MMKSYYSMTNLNIFPEEGKWGFDSVTNRELGWWLNGTDECAIYNRKDYINSAVEYLKMPKVTNKTEAIKL